MLIILSIKNGECIFFLTKWVWIETQEKNQQMKQQKDYSCFYAFFFPRMLFLCLKTDWQCLFSVNEF